MKLPIKVVPSSSRSCLAGWLGATLKLRVAAPVEHRKANAGAEKVVADALKVPKRSIAVTGGRTSAHKILEIRNLSESEVQARLSKVVS